MRDRIRFVWNRLREKLWVRPIGAVLLSIAGTFVAKAADGFGLQGVVPDISPRSLETLLSIMASSMLVIATFSVASMVSAYASASKNATPRSFTLILADDLSQYALSIFIGSFIFAIVSLIALENDYYEVVGRFALFVLTLFVFALVITTFIRWVDRVARLGRLGETVSRVESAAAGALSRRRLAPHLGGRPISEVSGSDQAIHPGRVGYIQRIDCEGLQACAAEHDLTVRVARLPGAFVTPDVVLAWYRADGPLPETDFESALRESFVLGNERLFDDDPRFGLVVLSEVAARALSPAVNDPGTAIDIIGRLVRLLTQWTEPLGTSESVEDGFDRIEVPALDPDDLLDDAFTAIARDGAAQVAVAVRLQKAFASLSAVRDSSLAPLARDHARRALRRAEHAMSLDHDLERVREAADL